MHACATRRISNQFGCPLRIYVNISLTNILYSQICLQGIKFYKIVHKRLPALQPKNILDTDGVMLAIVCPR